MEPTKPTDISTEASRTYSFPTGTVTITKPLSLTSATTAAGVTHTIVDATGLTHEVAAGWLVLSIKAATKADVL